MYVFGGKSLNFVVYECSVKKATGGGSASVSLNDDSAEQTFSLHHQQERSCSFRSEGSLLNWKNFSLAYGSIFL